MAPQGLNVLVSAASRHGSTAEIAAAIAAELQARGLYPCLLSPTEVTSVEGYDAVILGSAVYVGHWLASATDLATRCRAEFTGQPVWLFSSGPVGKPSGQPAQAMSSDPAELPEVRMATGARGHKIFAGKLNRKSLPFMQRVSLFLFSGLTGDFRDWTDIRQWADSIADQLTAIPQG